MKPILPLAAALLATLVAAPAFAQEGAPAASISAAAPPAKRGSFVTQLELLPRGKLTFGVGDDRASTATATAYGVGVTLAHDVTPNLSIGVAPRMLLGVAGEHATALGKQLDLRARVALHAPISRALQLYGFLEPGYSFIFVPGNEGDDPSGFVVAFGGGASVDLPQNAFLIAEVGYQLGFQSIALPQQDLELSTDYLALGLGAGTRF